jgi:hypothetical protein
MIWPGNLDKGIAECSRIRILTVNKHLRRWKMRIFRLFIISFAGFCLFTPMRASIAGAGREPVKAGRPAPRQVAEAQFLAHAQRVLEAATRLPRQGDERLMAGPYNRQDLFELIQELRSHEDRAGTSSQISFLLGRCYLETANYEQAVQVLGQAVPRWPNARGRLDFERAQQLLMVSRAAQPLSLPGQRIVQIEPLRDEKRGTVWVVLSFKQAAESDDDKTDLALTIFGGSPLQKLAQMTPAQDTALRNRYQLSTQQLYSQFTIIHQPGAKRPHIVLMGALMAGSATPSHVGIYEWADEGLRKLFGGYADDIAWIDDIKRDGRYEIALSMRVGRNMSEVEKVRWLDIWEWDGQAYVPADQHFPQVYREVAREMRRALRDHPDDDELLEYEGKLQRIRSHQQRAKVW